MYFTGDFARDDAAFCAALHLDKNYDLGHRTLQFGPRRAALFFVEAFLNSALAEKILAGFLTLEEADFAAAPTAEAFSKTQVPHTEVRVCENAATATVEMLAGMAVLLIEGYTACLLLDLRDYPMRSVSEPEDDRVLRGAHDGFCEAVKQNVSLIRRRVRTPDFCVEKFTVGSRSHTDVVLCYVQGVADERLVAELRTKLSAIDIPSLSMGQESLTECLVKTQKWNPLPKVRTTERPDRAAASVLEGKLIVMVDNSPVAMVLPTGIFDFMQDTNEYYFPPCTGTFLRAVRFGIFIGALLLIPTWYMLVENPSLLPVALEPLRIKESVALPLFWQILLVEWIVDGLKLASLNTPSALSNAFGIIGALILGEFAVSARILIPDVLLYMAFVSVSGFVQPSFQLGYAFKVFRLMLIVLIALIGPWGLPLGLLLMLLCIAFTHTVTSTSYLYPLVPLDPPSLLRLFVRRSIHRDNC
ncbi:MAG: spore germination protein [Clostridia bacterium]|nr:spore germination protein [Clostridia bacterium]